MAVSPDGKIVAAGAGMWDQPGEIGVWDLATRKPLQHFAEDLGVASVALSPNGKLLASGGWTGHVRVCDWAAGKELFDFPVAGVARVAFSPDGQLLATATEGKTAQLWDVVQGKLLADLEGDLLRFQCVTFSPDGKRVLAGGGDWKPGGVRPGRRLGRGQQEAGAETGRPCRTRSSASPIPPTARPSPPGPRTVPFASGTPTAASCLKTLPGHTHWVESVVFSADGKTLVSGGQDGTDPLLGRGPGQGNDRNRHARQSPHVGFTPDGQP